jgi:serine/threonine-protein kinase HipA
MAEENQISGTQVRRRVGELSQAVLDALPSVVDELNALKKSPVYQQISDCVAVNCRDMLRNLKSDVEDEPEEDPEPQGARPPGFS